MFVSRAIKTLCLSRKVDLATAIALVCFLFCSSRQVCCNWDSSLFSLYYPLLTKSTVFSILKQSVGLDFSCSVHNASEQLTLYVNTLRSRCTEFNSLSVKKIKKTSLKMWGLKLPTLVSKLELHNRFERRRRRGKKHLRHRQHFPTNKVQSSEMEKLCFQIAHLHQEVSFHSTLRSDRKTSVVPENRSLSFWPH